MRKQITVINDIYIITTNPDLVVESLIVGTSVFIKSLDGNR
ncbi:hypothetical protein [Clostridium intestinale]|nr:hypothetical protein [Clostridium intestinale]